MELLLLCIEIQTRSTITFMRFGAMTWITGPRVNEKIHHRWHHSMTRMALIISSEHRKYELLFVFTPVAHLAWSPLTDWCVEDACRKTGRNRTSVGFPNFWQSEVMGISWARHFSGLHHHVYQPLIDLSTINCLIRFELSWTSTSSLWWQSK